jgi:predicted protein tyrosine phosphatase
MHVFTAFLAADYLLERRRAADHRHLTALVAIAGEPRTSPFRRVLAHGFATISRASALAVRRLDACLADDLGRSLARTDGV